MAAITLLGLMVIGTLFLGLNDVQKKQFLKTGVTEQSVLCLSFLGLGIILGILLLITGIPVIEKGFLAAVAGTIFLNLFSQSFFMRAFSLSDASLIAPLRLVIPILVLGTGYLMLGETPSLGGIAGIFITIIGLYVLIRPTKTEIFTLERGVLYGLAGAVLFALSYPLDKIAVQTSSALFATFVIFGSLGLLFLIWNTLRNPLFLGTLLKLCIQRPLSTVGLAFTGAVGYVMTNQALNYSLTAYVSSLKRLQAFWTILFAKTFLQEYKLSQRLLGTAILFIGILVTLFVN